MTTTFKRSASMFALVALAVNFAGQRLGDELLGLTPLLSLGGRQTFGRRGGGDCRQHAPHQKTLRREPLLED